MRPALKTALKISLLLPLGLLGLAVVLYLLLLIINRHDQPPSQAYTALIQASEGRPLPPEHDNGFIFASGFHAARNEDPEKKGQAFIERQKDLARRKEFKLDYEGSQFSQAFSKLPENLSAAISSCSNPEGECLQRMFFGRKSLKEPIKESAWILDRYSKLISYQKWRETNAFTIWNEFPHYENLLGAQKIFFINTWISAYEGDSKSVSEAISRDHHFWRMVLSSTDSLLARMIAVSALNRNYQFGNLCFQSLPASAAFEIPAEWRTPYSLEEMSMQKVMGAELIFSREMLHDIWNMQSLSDDDTPEHIRIIAKQKNLLWKPLSLPQASLNTLASQYEKAMMSFNVPYVHYATAIKEAQADRARRKSLLSRIHIYNPGGQWLITQSEVGLYDDYFSRSADLEGARRLALLMAELHAQNVDTAELEAALAASSTRNPYTEKAFIVEPGTGYVVFTGIETDKKKARHAFLYR